MQIIEGNRVSGCAAPYNEVTTPFDKIYGEKFIFKPGSFNDWLLLVNTGNNQRIIPALLFHKNEFECGDVVKLEDREEGLWCEILLHDTPIGRDTKRLIEAEAIYFFSVGGQSKGNYNDSNEFEIGASTVEEISIAAIPALKSAVMDGAPQKTKEDNYKDLVDRLQKAMNVRGLESAELKKYLEVSWRHYLIKMWDRQREGRSIKIF